MLDSGRQWFAELKAIWSHAVQLCHYPATRSVADHLGGGNQATAQALFTEATNCIESARCFFEQKFNHTDSPLLSTVKVIKAARVVSPHWAL